MDIRKIYLVFVALLLLSLIGCTTNYLYTSRGSLTYPSGEEKAAVLYWRSDEGRLYYGPDYNESDSGVALRICNATPKSFNPAGNGNDALVLLSKSGDYKIAKIDSNGKVQMLDEGVLLNPQDNAICGKLFVSNNDAGINNLVEGSRPEIVFICENKIKKERYPSVDKYVFESILKAEEKEGPDPCIAQ